MDEFVNKAYEVNSKSKTDWSLNADILVTDYYYSVNNPYELNEHNITILIKG